MTLEKTKKLIEWLETNQLDREYSLDDLKELLSIAMTELSEQNDKTFESLPQGAIDAIIELMKANGEYNRHQLMIDNFKSKFRK